MNKKKSYIQNREVDDKTILDKFAEDFCKIVEEHCKYIVCSGFVAIAHGRTRGTEDIDMIIEKIDKEKFIELHCALLDKNFDCIQSSDAEEVFDLYLSQGESVRYVWKSDSFAPPEMEIKFAKDEIDNEQLSERVKFPLTKLDIFFSSIEANIAFKEELLKSDKDIEDAKHLRIIYEGEFNEDKIIYFKNKIKKIRLGLNEK
ncbi:MAG: hypothetical protein ACOCUU_02370 [Nanoarchaeota archaeon]